MGYIHNTHGTFAICPCCIKQSIEEVSLAPVSNSSSLLLLLLKDTSNTLDRFERMYSSERFFQLIQQLEPGICETQQRIKNNQEWMQEEEAKRDGRRCIDDTRFVLQSFAVWCAHWIWSFGLSLYEFVQLCKRYYGPLFICESKLENITSWYSDWNQLNHITVILSQTLPIAISKHQLAVLFLGILNAPSGSSIKKLQPVHTILTKFMLGDTIKQ